MHDAHFGLTNAPYASWFLAGLSVLPYVARSAAKKKARVSLAHPEMLPIIEDALRVVYMVEGVPENYKPDQVRFLSS
jgi:hypothetical protein